MLTPNCTHLLVFTQAQAYAQVVFERSWLNFFQISTSEELSLPMKLCATFIYLHFGFEIFWQKNIETKAAH